MSTQSCQISCCFSNTRRLKLWGLFNELSVYLAQNKKRLRQRNGGEDAGGMTGATEVGRKGEAVPLVQRHTENICPGCIVSDCV